MVLVPDGMLWRVTYPSAVWALNWCETPLLKARRPLMRTWTRASLVGTAMSPLVPAGAGTGRVNAVLAGAGTPLTVRGPGGGGICPPAPWTGPGGGFTRPGRDPGPVRGMH